MLRLRRSIPASRLRDPPESLRSPHWGERLTAFALSGFDPPMLPGFAPRTFYSFQSFSFGLLFSFLACPLFGFKLFALFRKIIRARRRIN